jgi:hypothetical protein
MLLHKSLKENIKPACSISYVIVESDGAERHQRRDDDNRPLCGPHRTTIPPDMSPHTSISRFFESVGASLKNVRWSWGAQRRDGALFLRGAISGAGLALTGMSPLPKKSDACRKVDQDAGIAQFRKIAALGTSRAFVGFVESAHEYHVKLSPRWYGLLQVSDAA